MTVQAVVSDDRRFVRLTIVPFFSRSATSTTFTFEGSVVDAPAPASTTDNDDDGKNEKKDNSDSTNRTAASPSVADLLVRLGHHHGQRARRRHRALGRHQAAQRRPQRIRRADALKLPYINRLFKNVGIGRETNSLMMMVTPRIIIQEEEEERLGIAAP